MRYSLVPTCSSIWRPRARSATKKLVLVVIDALKPAMLERAIANGRAPALARVHQLLA